MCRLHVDVVIIMLCTVEVFWSLLPPTRLEHVSPQIDRASFSLLHLSASQLSVNIGAFLVFDSQAIITCLPSLLAFLSPPPCFPSLNFSTATELPRHVGPDRFHPTLRRPEARNVRQFLLFPAYCLYLTFVQLWPAKEGQGFPAGELHRVLHHQHSPLHPRRRSGRFPRHRWRRSLLQL